MTKMATQDSNDGGTTECPELAVQCLDECMCVINAGAVAKADEVFRNMWMSIGHITMSRKHSRIIRR